TSQYKTGRRHLERDGGCRRPAKQCRSFCSRQLCFFRIFRASKTPPREKEMTTIDEILPRPKRRSRRTRILLFFLVETIAAFLMGFAALFLNFPPAWSAESAPATLTRASDARSGSLLLKTEDGYADATRLGIDVDLNVSGPTIRAKVTQ